MTNKQRAMAVLNYRDYDRLPIVHFGFWNETLLKWADEGYISIEEAKSWADGTPVDKSIGDKLGFDFNWYNCFHLDCGLRPEFDRKVIKELPDGSKHVLDPNGAIVLEKGDAGSIPAEIDHTLNDVKGGVKLRRVAA